MGGGGREERVSGICIIGTLADQQRQRGELSSDGGGGQRWKSSGRHEAYSLKLKLSVGSARPPKNNNAGGGTRRLWKK